jgi:hypothetical protein
MFAGKTTDFQLTGDPLFLPTNIRLGWKGLPVTNALAYLKKIVKLWMKKVLYHWPQVCTMESRYLVQQVDVVASRLKDTRIDVRLPIRQPGACIIKPITAVIYGFRNKLEFLYWQAKLRDKHSSLLRKP